MDFITTRLLRFADCDPADVRAALPRYLADVATAT